jgi:hypothetical protein
MSEVEEREGLRSDLRRTGTKEGGGGNAGGSAWGGGEGVNDWERE